MVALERIDKIKTDLQNAKQGLHEADNWTVLATDVEEVYILACDLFMHLMNATFYRYSNLEILRILLINC